MTIMILTIILWILFPFFGIPFSIVKHSECKKLVKRIEELEFENKKLYYERTHKTDSGYVNAPGRPDDSVTDENNLTAHKEKQGNQMYPDPDMSEASDSAYSMEINSDAEVYEESASETSMLTDGAYDTNYDTAQKENIKAKNVSGLLITGVSLVLLAGLIFVTTNWNSIGDGFKIFLIMLATGMFFGASVFTEKKLGLKSTGKGFFVLGTLFIPVTCISFFFFEIFGSWFSFAGEGMCLALMSVFLSCSLSCVLITHKYNAAPSAFASMMFMSAAVVSFGFFTEWLAAFMIITAAYSVLLLAVKEEFLIRLEIPFVYIRIFRIFTRINAFALAFIGFIFAASEESTCSMATAVVFALAATLFVQFTTEHEAVKTVCRIASAIEYIIAAVIISSPIWFTSDDSSVILMLICMMIPALAVSAFVPKLKSQLTSSVLNAFAFIVSVSFFGHGHPLGCILVLAMAVTSAVSFRSVAATAQASVYSVPLIWQFLYLMDLRDSDAAFAVSLTVSVLFVVSVLFSRKYSELKAVSVTEGIYALCIPVITGMIWCDHLVNISSILIASAAFGAVSYICYRRENSTVKVVSAIVSSIYFQLSAFLFFSEHIFKTAYQQPENVPVYIIGFILTAAAAAAGILIRKYDKTSGKTVVYTSVFTVIINVLFNAPYSTGLWPFVFEAVIVSYLILCGMVSGEKSSKAFWTAASVVGAYAAATQNFFKVSDVILPEYIIFCSFIPYFLLFRIFSESKKSVNMLMFVQSCICMMILGLCAVERNDLVHALVIGIISVAVIMLSAFTADRKWRVFGTVTLVLLVLYITRDFWASLAWWVYLLAAGIILIGYAAFNEYCRKTGTENVIKNAVKSAISRSNDK